MVASWRKWLNPKSQRFERDRRPGTRPRPFQPHLEHLEDRLLLAVFSVTNTNDAGPGSLRDAMTQANTTPGNTINFHIDKGVQLIQPLTALPVIDQNPVIIDGTPPADLPTQDIQLDGTKAGNKVGLKITAGNSTIKNLTVVNWVFAGISLTEKGGNTIQGNYIGIDKASTAKGNSSGIDIDLHCDSNLIGGNKEEARNVISGNKKTGISIYGNNNAVIGNYVGTDTQGVNRVPNQDGIAINGWNNTIGGMNPGELNVISGNKFDGVSIGPTMEGNTVQGNYIGTDVSGTKSLFNGLWGVNVAGSNNTIGGIAKTDANGVITQPANVISANGKQGVRIISGSGNVVQGNFIGVDVTGGKDLGNGDGGILILNSNGNGRPIGGLVNGARNVISANKRANPTSGNGIHLNGADNYVIQGNYIGTDKVGDKTKNLGNKGKGIYLENGSSGNKIKNSLIAFNAGAGVDLAPDAGTGNKIADPNSIFANGFGMDLGDDGVTLNDSHGHSGPNNYQNFPILTSAVGSATQTLVRGFLDSPNNPQQTFTLEFFANDAGDSSGYGQGETFIGAQQVTTDATGHACFTFAAGGLLGKALTATATDPNDNTSEFAKDRVVDGGFTIDPGGIADLVMSATGFGGTLIKPTVGCYMLHLSSTGTTDTSGFQDSQGHAGTRGTIIRNTSLSLAANTTISFDWFFTSILYDFFPASEFTLGLLNGNQLFGVTQLQGAGSYDSGWQHYSTTVSAGGTYQLVFVDSQGVGTGQQPPANDSELYLSNAEGFNLDLVSSFVGPSSSAGRSGLRAGADPSFGEGSATCGNNPPLPEPVRGVDLSRPSVPRPSGRTNLLAAALPFDPSLGGSMTTTRPLVTPAPPAGNGGSQEARLAGAWLRNYPKTRKIITILVKLVLVLGFSDSFLALRWTHRRSRARPIWRKRPRRISMP